ncbi:MAG: DUF4412 domain-containing protein [Chthoniobacteraceae bacterium]
MRSAFILLALAVTARADWTITQKVEGGMNSGQMVLRIKDDKARLDVSTQISILTDLKTGDSTTLNHTSRIYLRIPASEAAKMRETALGLKDGAAAGAPTLASTGRKEKLGEFECEVFTWALGEMKVTDWIAAGYPNFKPVLDVLARFQNAGLARSAQPLMPPIESFPGMVVKREMNHRGTVTTTTLLSAREAPLDAKLFDLPADYKAQPALQLPAAK